MSSDALELPSLSKLNEGREVGVGWKEGKGKSRRKINAQNLEES